MRLFNELKAFILRGNVVDMAVGIIIGAAFSAIVSSLVTNVLMPPIGWATGSVDFRDLSVDLPGKMVDPKLRAEKSKEQLDNMSDAEKIVPVKNKYGEFLQKVIHFLIVGLCLFFVVKGMNTLLRKKAAAPTPPEPTPTEKLLAEIRDSIQKKS